MKSMFFRTISLFLVCSQVIFGQSPGQSRIERVEKGLLPAVKVNVELYPQSSNVYDSLGEAHLANGDKELAAINYKKSLELDPHNQSAANMLKKLQP